MRGGVSAVGLTGHEGTSGSVTAASSHLETQSSEVPWDVPLQNQGPLNLKRPEGRPPWAGDFPKTSSRTSLPTAEAVGGHVDPPWAPQNSFSFKQAEPAASGTLVWTSAPFSLSPDAKGQEPDTENWMLSANPCLLLLRSLEPASPVAALAPIPVDLTSLAQAR